MRQIDGRRPVTVARPIVRRIVQGHTSRKTVVMGEEGLEQTRSSPGKTAKHDSECAHLCAVGEIPAFVRDLGRSAAWNELSEDFQQRIASLPPEVLAALSALFGGRQRQR